MLSSSSSSSSSSFATCLYSPSHHRTTTLLNSSLILTFIDPLVYFPSSFTFFFLHCFPLNLSGQSLAAITVTQISHYPDSQTTLNPSLGSFSSLASPQSQSSPPSLKSPNYQTPSIPSKSQSHLAQPNSPLAIPPSPPHPVPPPIQPGVSCLISSHPSPSRPSPPFTPHLKEHQTLCAGDPSPH